MRLQVHRTQSGPRREEAQESVNARIWFNRMQLKESSSKGCRRNLVLRGPPRGYWSKGCRCGILDSIIKSIEYRHGIGLFILLKLYMTPSPLSYDHYRDKRGETLSPILYWSSTCCVCCPPKGCTSWLFFSDIVALYGQRMANLTSLIFYL